MNLSELPEHEQAQYKEVASELRCLVCQNQSLADSHASLATDLKLKIIEQIQQGKSNPEIKAYMQERYGEFILYKPQYSAENAALWLGPLLAILVGAFVAWRVLRRSRNLPDTPQ